MLLLTAEDEEDAAGCWSVSVSVEVLELAAGASAAEEEEEKEEETPRAASHTSKYSPVQSRPS